MEQTLEQKNKISNSACKWFDLYYEIQNTTSTKNLTKDDIANLFHKYCDKWCFQLEQNCITKKLRYACRVNMKNRIRLNQLANVIGFKQFEIKTTPKDDIGILSISDGSNIVIKNVVTWEDYNEKVVCKLCDTECDGENLLLHMQECASQTIKKLKLDLDNAKKLIEEKDETIKIQNDKIKNYKRQVISKSEIIRLKENKIKNQDNLSEKLNLEAQILELQKSLEYEKGGKAALEKTLGSSIIKPIPTGVSDTGKRSYKSAKIGSCDTDSIRPLTEKLVGDMIHEYTRDRFLRTEEGYVEFLLILFMNSTEHSYAKNKHMKSNYICTNNTRHSFHYFTENGSWVKDGDGLFFRKINDIIKPVLNYHWNIVGEEHNKEYYKCSDNEQRERHAAKCKIFRDFSMDALAGDKDPERRTKFENRIKAKLKKYIYIEAKKVGIDEDDD